MNISDEFNSIFSLAAEEAMRTGSIAVLPDHVLLGILRHADNRACRALTALGVDLEEVKRRLDRCLMTSRSVPFERKDEVMQDSRTITLTGDALMEVLDKGDLSADSAHLLAALLKDERSLASPILRSMGVNRVTLAGALRRDAAAQEARSRATAIAIAGALIRNNEIYS